MLAVVLAASIVLQPSGDVALRDASIRLGDVARLPGRATRLARRELARLPGGRTDYVLSRYAVAALIRRALPGLSLAGGPDMFHFRAPATDRAAVAPFAPNAPAVTRGADLTLIARAGPITVARAVTALQPGHAGGRLFVRDRAGRVFAATLIEAAR